MAMEKSISIGQASKMLGVSNQTLRTWDASGKLKPHHKTDGGTRYYTEEQIRQFMTKIGNSLNVCCVYREEARVPMEEYCKRHSISDYEILKYSNDTIVKIVELAIDGRINKLLVDRSSEMCLLDNKVIRVVLSKCNITTERI